MIPEKNARSSNGQADRRVDGPVDVIDEAVVIATLDGVGPAIDHMAAAGVRRATAMRVLSGPEFHRVPGERVLAKALAQSANPATPSEIDVSRWRPPA